MIEQFFYHKLSSVDVMQLPSGNAGTSRGAWSPILVRINTDEGSMDCQKRHFFLYTILIQIRLILIRTLCEVCDNETG